MQRSDTLPKAKAPRRASSEQGGQMELALSWRRGRGWFLSFQVRYVHLHEGEAIDEAQLTAWIQQAAKLPGWLT